MAIVFDVILLENVGRHVVSTSLLDIKFACILKGSIEIALIFKYFLMEWHCKNDVVEPYMPYFSGHILGLYCLFSGTNVIFLGQILQNSGTNSGASCKWRDAQRAMCNFSPL